MEVLKLKNVQLYIKLQYCKVVFIFMVYKLVRIANFLASLISTLLTKNSEQMPVLISMVACNSDHVFISQQERFVVFRKALISHHRAITPPKMRPRPPWLRLADVGKIMLLYFGPNLITMGLRDSAGIQYQYSSKLGKVDLRQAFDFSYSWFQARSSALDLLQRYGIESDAYSKLGICICPQPQTY